MKFLTYISYTPRYPAISYEISLPGTNATYRTSLRPMSKGIINLDNIKIKHQL